MACSPGPESANDTKQDAKVKVLEEQLRQTQEQNRQIMEMLKNMQGQQGADGSSATQSTAVQQPSPTALSAPTQAQPATSAPPTPVQQQPAEKFTPGWLACIMATKNDDNKTRNNNNPYLQLGDKIGCFVAEKESYDYKEYFNISGIPKDPQAGWKGEAFFETRESGRHSFIINFEYTPNRSVDCLIASGLKIEDQEIFNETKKNDYCNTSITNAFTGGADLEPGRYKVEFWIYLSDKKTFDRMRKATFAVYTKKPSDALPTPAYQSMKVRAEK